ncbi:MAG: ATP-binding protein [Pseudomonadota bacterium]
MIYPRTLAPFVRQASATFPVVLLTGARQVGKTTLLQAISEPNRQYVSLDDPLMLALAREEPALFLQRFPAPVLIDEIQHAPQLLPHIKLAVDGQRQPGSFWLTGSQAFHLMRGVSESLAGRVAVVRLLGFSRREAERRGERPAAPFLPAEPVLADYCTTGKPLGLSRLYELIWRGSYPALIQSREADRDLFYGSYLQTYIQRDVRDFARVNDAMAFLRFVRAAAARTAQLLNVAELARDADVAPNTAKSWLSILEASGLVYLLQPWHSNFTKRLVKTPKLYFLDTGLCSYLTQWSSPQSLEAGALSVAIFETWVMVELLKSYWHRGKQAPFYFYRDKDLLEIDLLIEADGVLYPIEIKKTSSPARNAMKGAAALGRSGANVGPGVLICMVTQTVPLKDNVTAIPVGCL